jgi:hypothetical protein
MYAAVCAWSWAVVDFAGSEAIRVEPANTWPGRIAHRTNLPFPTPENGGALTAVADRLVYFACSRVSTKPTSKPPQRGCFSTWLLA